MATLEQHIAYLMQHGMARTNRFMVVIPLPDKLVLPSRKFSGTVGSELQQSSGSDNRTTGVSSGVDGSRALELKVSQTTFPMKNISQTETKYNGDVHKMAGTISYGAQQFVFECSEDLYEKNVIDAWMNLIINPNSYENSYYRDYVTDIFLHQLDMQDRPTHTVVIQDAYPMMCNELTLSNKEMNNTHELMTTFSFKRWYSSSSDSANTVLNEQINTILASSDVLQPYLEELKIDPRLKSGIDIIGGLKELGLEGEANAIVMQLDKLVTSVTNDTIGRAAGLLTEFRRDVTENLGLDDYDIGIITRSIDDTLSEYLPGFSW